MKYLLLLLSLPLLLSSCEQSLVSTCWKFSPEEKEIPVSDDHKVLLDEILLPKQMPAAINKFYNAKDYQIIAWYPVLSTLDSFKLVQALDSNFVVLSQEDDAERNAVFQLLENKSAKQYIYRNVKAFEGQNFLLSIDFYSEKKDVIEAMFSKRASLSEKMNCSL